MCVCVTLRQEAEGAVAKVIDMHGHRTDVCLPARSLAVCVAVSVVMRFILFSTVTCFRDVIDYHMNSIPVIKSRDDLVI